MKLINLRVDAFGKLKDFQMDFSEGLNVIKQKNGFGKTTLAEFICAMFYGFPETRSKLLSENPRVKYRPWGSDKFGGSLTLEKDLRVYRIERSFDRKGKSGDILRVYDRETGRETEALGSLGRELFSIDRDAFKRCVYLPQNAIEVTAEDDISRRLTEMLSGVDEARYTEALERLDKERAFWYKTGGRGELAKLKSEYSEASEQLERCKAELKDIEKQTLVLEELEGRLSACDKQLEKNEEEAQLEKRILEALEAKETLSQAQKRAQYIESVNAQRVEKEKQLAVLIEEEKQLADKKAIEERKRSYIGIAKEYRLYESDSVLKKKKADDVLSCFKKLPDESFFVKSQELIASQNDVKKRIEDSYDQINKAKEDKAAVVFPSKPKPVLLAIFIVLASLAAVLGLLMLLIPNMLADTIGFILLGVLFVASLVTGTLAMKKQSAYLTAKNSGETALSTCDAIIETNEIFIQKLSAQLNEVVKQIEGYFAQYGVSIDEGAEKAVSDVKRKIETAAMLREDAQTAAGRLMGFTPEVLNKVYAAESFSEELYEALVKKSREITELKLKLSEDIAGAKRVEEESSDYNEILDKANRGFLAASSGLTSLQLEEGARKGEAERAREALLKQRAELIRDVAQKQTEIREAAKRSGSVSEAEEKCVNLEVEIARGERRLSNVRAAMNALENANVNLSGSFLPKVKEKFGGFLASVQANAYPEVSIDGSFKIKLSEGGLSRELEYFSAGTKDLMYFGLRLCLMESMYGGKLPLLIADDCFTNLDEEKFERITQILENIAKDTQVFYMTCYRDFGAKSIEPEISGSLGNTLEEDAL